MGFEKLKNDFFKKNKIKILFIAVILLQTLIFIKAGIDKSYIHMDEAYSLGLASYDKVEIQDNEDFYNTWHNKEYYEDYLAVNDDEVSDFSPVYINQKNDVHPPLYYLFLRVAMSFSQNHFSKWSGITINIIIYVFITLFVYLIFKKLLEGKQNYEVKSIIFAFISSITLASLTNVIYIRMYALASLNVIIITYLHIKLYEKYENKTLILIGLSALIGSLTHYFFLFYLGVLYLITIIRLFKNKEIKKLIFYTLTLLIAGIISLAIFPYSIQHMFFGYRGDGVISNLTDIKKLPESMSKIYEYLKLIQIHGFNNVLIFIIIAIIGLLIYKKCKNINNKVEKRGFLKLIYLPSLVYLILVGVSSPWVELRYILPICASIFITMFYVLNELLETVVDNKKASETIFIFIILIIINPFIFNMEPQETYSDRKEIVDKLQNELNLPTVFWFNSNNNRFLDDILLFSKINESYVAKDMECNEENVNMIFSGKDLNNGIIVFMNEGQDNDFILNKIKEYTKLNNINYLKRMNACDIYYIN